MKLSKLISASMIEESLDKNDFSLYDERFGFGKEHDINEFAVSLERKALHLAEPFHLTLHKLVENSMIHEDLLQSIIKNRNESRNNDPRLSKFESVIDDSFSNYSEPTEERIKELKKKIEEKYAYLINDESKLSDLSPIELLDEATSMQLYLHKRWDLRTLYNDNKYLTVNEATVLENSFTSNRDLIFMHRTMRLGQILSLMLSKKLQKLPKTQKPQLYYTSSGMRPSTTSYHSWNGMQVFDIDLKNSTTEGVLDNVKGIKQKLYDNLKHYPWLVCVGLSSSQKGIHIYTKVSRPHHMYVRNEDNEDMLKFWYRMSYTQKYAAIRYILKNICNIDLAEDKRKKVIDLSVARITQGIKIAYDEDLLINDRFEDIHPAVGFHIPPVETLALDEWLFDKQIIENSTFISWQNEFMASHEISDVKRIATALEEKDFTVEDFELKDVSQYHGDIYYQLRYNVCNTLASIFGEKGRTIAHHVLKSEACKNVSEINNMYNCSVNAKKSATAFGVQVLQKCGVPINYSQEAQQQLNDNLKSDLEALIKNATTSHSNDKYNSTFTLTLDRYLGDIENSILSSLSQGKANLLYSPPGTGKTEFVKSLAKKKRVLLVLPYISVIDAKIVRDLEASGLFDVYFGSKSTENIEKGRSAVMTIDKFSNLDVEKVSYFFDYVFVDEDHLMFTSSFRLDTMSNALKTVKKFLAVSELDNYAAKVVLMTGTPTGEIPYYGFYDRLNAIKVIKQETRHKYAKFVLCEDTEQMQYMIASHIASSLSEEKKILYPTNAGDIQAVKLVGMVEHILGRPIKWGYYKKANAESEMAININENATVGDYELVLASNYLSVGIDIKDLTNFECIYDNSFAGFEIEQFNCRLRLIDIYSTIYIPCYNASGEITQNLLNHTSFSLSLERSDRDLIRDYIDISNKKMELTISYDPITNRINTPGFKIENGQIVFKLEEHELTLFEERYLENMRSPYFMAKSLCEYGYEVSVTVADIQDSENVKQVIGSGLECAKIESDIRNAKYVHNINWMFSNDTYVNAHNIAETGIISKVFQGDIPVTEDRKVEDITVEEGLLGDVAKIKVPDKRIFDEQLLVAHRLLSMYSPDTASFLYNSCIRESGKINMSEVSRYMRLISLIRSEERGTLGKEISVVIDDVHEYVEKFNNEDFYVTNAEHDARIDALCYKYLSELGLNLRTEKMISKYRDEVNELVNVLTKKERPHKGELRLDYRILPTPDSDYRIKKAMYDSILMRLFKASDDKLPEELKALIKSRHMRPEDISAVKSLEDSLSYEGANPKYTPY